MVEVSDGASCADALKEGLSGKRFKAAIACKAGDTLLDLTAPVPTTTETLTLTPVTADTPEGLGLIRHSAAHVMAAAVKKLFPAAKVTIGPSIENGFYYDFDVETPFSPDQFEAIEAEMQRIIDAAVPFERMDISKADAVKLFNDMGEPYKVELIEGLEDGTITLYRNGDFVDLCRGPHIPNAGFVKAFKLLSVAGAYWRGDEKNRMLSRIYATAFADAKDLKEYLNRIEEAKRRDHRKLGKELDLFAFHEDVAAGMVFWLPKGMLLRTILEDFLRREHIKRGYQLVQGPQVLRRELWEQSGHYANYRENMYFTEIEGDMYGIKPMNCVSHMLIYNAHLRSYRELPQRYFELGVVHRHEKSGQLHGLMRVRCFTQDDAHIFMMPEQIRDEIKGVVALIDEVYSLFGFKYHVELSTRPEDSMGSDEDWEMATDALRGALDDLGLPYVVNEGDGAFYGPKIDIQAKNVYGKEDTMVTIQLDCASAEKFGMYYIDEKGEKVLPWIIHRTSMGCYERTLAWLIEHYAGKFPTWLCPEQVRVLPISEKYMDYANKVAAELKKKHVDVTVDSRAEKIGYKIREARLDKLPYMLVVGQQEEADGTVSVRSRFAGDEGVKPLQEFIDQICEEIRTKEIRKEEVTE